MDDIIFRDKGIQIGIGQWKSDNFVNYGRYYLYVLSEHDMGWLEETENKAISWVLAMDNQQYIEAMKTFKAKESRQGWFKKDEEQLCFNTYMNARRAFEWVQATIMANELRR